MSDPASPGRGSGQAHFVGILVVTVVVMVLGVLVVTYPDQMGVPRPPTATPAATPVAGESS